MAERTRVPRIPTHAETQANPGILDEFNTVVIEEFRATGGKVGGPFADSAVLLLTTTGARSGQRRQTPLEYFTVDDRILIAGTRGGAPQNPAWVHNLRAHPAVHVEIGTDAYGAVAQEITGAERDDLFTRIVQLCPRIDSYPKPARIIPVFELRRARPHS
ncbi:nitroreductase/quinone reductase family protein [Mycolicibacterium goodii]|uniref:Nitroreductase family deazaflavin-dependent oxidoreductase n=1 Tax=Mycolicibacterium goodii TaxID=134601 RepID=A0A0K0X2J1_MYCGD|nr:hypothetical protein AFA91_05990 [Mycolicibacterium goodii]